MRCKKCKGQLVKMIDIDFCQQCNLAYRDGKEVKKK